MADKCFFGCDIIGTPLIDITNVRKKKIITSSKKRRDDLHVKRRILLDDEDNIKCHKSCISTYTSETHVRRHLKRKSIETPDHETPVKRPLRDNDKYFSFEKHCLFCGEQCCTDKKNPKRTKTFSVCHSINADSLKNKILDTCKRRCDEKTMIVHARVQGAVSDLAAVKARYHRDCASMFLTVRQKSDKEKKAFVQQDSNENRSPSKCFNESGLHEMLELITNKIKDEVKMVRFNSNEYDGSIDAESTKKTSSATLLKLLGMLSAKLENSLPALLITSIVTGVITGHNTPLQIALGVKLRRAKKFLKLFSGLGVTCSHDEVLRFRKSAAKSVVEGAESLSPISRAECGLVQVVSDNFDAEISSQNCKRSTHSLAMLLTQPQTEDENVHQMTFPRIKKEDMTNSIEYDVPVHIYKGPHKPHMPETCAARVVPKLQLMAQEALAKHETENRDFDFMRDIVRNPTCPEFNAYNSSLLRRLGELPQRKTKVAYLPLIDMKPASHDTMMTAMVEAQAITHRTGQNYVLLTCDMQLYRISLEVKWAYPHIFADMILRLGGMHTLMSFVGSVGTLMEDSGLAEILSDVFGSVSKMLTGKKFPQNVRALRMVAEEALRPVLEMQDTTSHQKLMEVLEEKRQKSKTAKLWIDMVIKPVFIMMMFIRAEREACWLLHLESFRLMMPYFFAAGHINYARYGTYYLPSMEALPEECLERFMRGEHVMRHNDGIWNGIWSDMLIETTFMRYGHSSGGVMGITLKPDTLKVWALSMHACTSLEADLEEMIASNNVSQKTHTHKESGASRIESDQADRRAIREKMDTCIDPMDTTNHPEDLINIVTGQIAKQNVNVCDAVCIGTTSMKDFEEQLPKGFYNTISKKVTTMAAMKDNIKIGEMKLHDANLIYQRIIGLMASGRNVDIQEIFKHELAPFPTSMFNDSCDMRIPSSKSTLKKLIQVELSGSEHGDHNDVTLIDGSALLWIIRWPVEGIVRDYISSIKKDLARRLKESDIFIVFDRYYEYSVKSVTRGGRTAGASREHCLHLNTKLPSQKVALTVSKNKQQIIDLITADLVADVSFHENTRTHKLVVTGSDPVPVEIWQGEITKREDLRSTYEEADNTIVHQLLHLTKIDSNMNIQLIADDTDIFVLVIFYIHKYYINNPNTMKSPIKERTTVVDMNATAEKHADIVENLIAVHALTGCDTVACYHGIGKVTAVKVLKSGISLRMLGDKDAPYESALLEGTKFISACYGHPRSVSMSVTRLRVWADKTGRGSASHPNLCCLPPTSEGFEENFKRARYQAIVWSTLDEDEPPELDPEQFGWKKDVRNKTLIPVRLPENTKQAPDSVLKMLKCGCRSIKPCNTRSCSCRNASTPCTIFCACFENGCCNAHKDNT